MISHEPRMELTSGTNKYSHASLYCFKVRCIHHLTFFKLIVNNPYIVEVIPYLFAPISHPTPETNVPVAASLS